MSAQKKRNFQIEAFKHRVMWILTVICYTLFFMYYICLPCSGQTWTIISKSIEAAQGELFLEELNRKWAKLNKALQMIRDILMYMDITFIPSTHKTPIHELGLNLWRDVAIHSSKTQPRLLCIIHCASGFIHFCSLHELQRHVVVGSLS
ncbi:hypothetical protein M0R45_030774 [Rubus argutus]|uniref:Cullin N-terminal domain-containing protein n=1 Tax=Rubus argutus TaxID=59490 RepID=A0AAW1WFM1_RUBAR